MKENPDLVKLLEAVIEGLAVIHGWAEFALLSPQSPLVQEQALKAIKLTACQLARLIQHYPGSCDADGEPMS
ncbi:MAG: hypothetical protein ETSY1_22175 [Candidatus Entotheonella factor]|uniref:HEPN domain-containing protein n=1 Tax=Entotheonella factor TaxID=1429438 RepID=W4LI22_ENTF1|nr:MAG: hypothetical protein ETSY1_22175 [Candidatus Entotheonella factor]